MKVLPPGGIKRIKRFRQFRGNEGAACRETRTGIGFDVFEGFGMFRVFKGVWGVGKSACGGETASNPITTRVSADFGLNQGNLGNGGESMNTADCTDAGGMILDATGIGWRGRDEGNKGSTRRREEHSPVSTLLDGHSIHARPGPCNAPETAQIALCWTRRHCADAVGQINPNRQVTPCRRWVSGEILHNPAHSTVLQPGCDLVAGKTVVDFSGTLGMERCLTPSLTVKHSDTKGGHRPRPRSDFSRPPAYTSTPLLQNAHSPEKITRPINP